MLDVLPQLGLAPLGQEFLLFQIIHIVSCLVVCLHKFHCLYDPCLAVPASTNTPVLVTDVAPVLQAASNPLNGILLQTAVVDVSAGQNAFNTRMVLDSGAVMLLVISKLVNSIRTKKLHTNVAILSLGGTTLTHTRIEDAQDRDMTVMETQFGLVLEGDSCREEALAEPKLQPAM